jgi:hypothetical protein
MIEFIQFIAVDERGRALCREAGTSWPSRVGSWVLRSKDWNIDITPKIGPHRFLWNSQISVISTEIQCKFNFQIWYGWKVVWTDKSVGITDNLVEITSLWVPNLINRPTRLFVFPASICFTAHTFHCSQERINESCMPSN